jgi:RNA polymerase sigma factor for flagellar operon FliA
MPFGAPIALEPSQDERRNELTKALSCSHDPAQRGITGQHGRLDAEKRQRLILNHLAEVRRIARRIHARLPIHILFDDIAHSGVLGLIDAVDRFDPARNVSLQAYAQVRIRGAILDSLRELDWSPRSLRQQARRIELAHNELMAKWGRVPAEPEIAAHLGLRLDKFQHILSQLHSLTVGALHDSLELNSSEKGPVALPDIGKENPFELCARAEVSRILTAAVEGLSYKERQALALYYFEERTMKEVGRALSLHESRVSQIIGLALDRLRERLLSSKCVS